MTTYCPESNSNSGKGFNPLPLFFILIFVIILFIVGFLVFPSTSHGEFDLLKNGINLDVRGGRLSQKGDGRSNGSITLYYCTEYIDPAAGIKAPEPGVIYFYIVKRVNSHTQFMGIKANWAEKLIGSGTTLKGWEQLGSTTKYFDPSSMKWSLAWWIGKERTGKETSPDTSWLTVGASELKLQIYFKKCLHPVQEVGSIPWPSQLK